MTEALFRTPNGISVPAVSAAEIREIDRVAVEDVGLELLQMMENAGRTLAVRVLEREPDQVTVLAGNGGNGGGGMACARHLENRNVSVTVVLDRSTDALDGAAAEQYRILDEMNVDVVTTDVSDTPAVVIDALVGYGLEGELRGRTRALVDQCTDLEATIVSLDVPSGLDATTGEQPGSVVEPDETVTLALLKVGLSEIESKLTLADLSIPQTVYDRVGIEYNIPFDRSYCVPLMSAALE